MQGKNLFSISNFAKFSRTTRDTLLFYDKIGLLSPVSRAQNGYRYYSAGQLAIVNLIRTCQSLEMPLAEIKKLTEYRSPKVITELLVDQIERMDEKVNELNRSRKLMTHLKNIISTAFDADTEACCVQLLPEEAIVLGGVNDYSDGRDDYDALLSFYQACSEQNPQFDMNYPVWGMFSRQQVVNGERTWPERYYFSNPEGSDRRPAGLYAIGYGKGGYGDYEEIYTRLLAFIEVGGYEICGPSYAEHPLNEISISDPSNYLTRLLITVKKKDL